MQWREILIGRGVRRGPGGCRSLWPPRFSPEWHSFSPHRSPRQRRPGLKRVAVGGNNGWSSAHRCLLLSLGSLTRCPPPARRGPVRPAPLPNSLISRKDNNVRARFHWDKNEKRAKSCCLRLPLSPLPHVITEPRLRSSTQYK